MVFGEMQSSWLDSHRNQMQNGMVERLNVVMATISARCALEVDFSKHGVWQNAVVMAGFAQKFDAKWYGRAI